MTEESVMDETDLNPEKKWYKEQLVNKVIKNLEKKGMVAQYAQTREEALTAIIEMIPKNAIVARGDSVTVDQVGIISELEKRKQRVIDPMERNPDGTYVVPSRTERKKIAREAFSADIFLVGANAVTMDGKLVNIDGWGNRVAAMIFGPEKVIVVAGINKIVKDVDEALARIHNYAAPMNAKRHFFKHHLPDFGDLPCARTGVCVDCSHDWRICRNTVIIEGTMIIEKDRINVVLVDEDLGI
ncbi:lactate utilization protein [Chloroflexota bacterium]